MRLLPQGGDGMLLIERLAFELQHASIGRRETCTLFNVLGLRSRSGLVACVTVAYDTCELNLESRYPLTLLLDRGLHRVAQLDRRKSGSFLLGEARVGSGDRARIVALPCSEGFTFRELRGFERCDARVTVAYDTCELNLK